MMKGVAQSLYLIDNHFGTDTELSRSMSINETNWKREHGTT